MPKAFGEFPFKLDCVCDECNGLFGRGVEQQLARDSVEGFLRAHFGLKPKDRDRPRRLGGKRLAISVNERSDWNGVLVSAERDPTGKFCPAHPLPGASLRRKGESEWKWFPESDLNAEAVKPYIAEPEALLSGLPDEIRRLQDKLAELGIRPKKGWELENRSGLARVFVNSVCDDVILRAVAKIAFNFLAYMEGSNFALKDDFNDIRKYIRWGAMPRAAPVQIFRPPTLAEGNTVRPKHAVVLNWDVQKKGIACLVSLFGYQVYQVTLCEDYSGIWRPISAGRIFDLQTGNASELSGLDLVPSDAWVQTFWGSPERNLTSAP